MNVLQSKELKQRAALRLNEASGFRKTVVLHSAVSLGALIAVMVLDLLLSNAMNQTGGLSGIGARSVLGTVQGVLSTAVNILLPFWELGILYTAVRTARQQTHSFSMLTRGFQRLGPVLRYYLVQLGILFAVLTVCLNVVMFFTSWIPMPEGLQTALTQLDPTAISDPEQLLTQLPMDLLLSYLAPVLILFTLIYCGVLIHLGYRFRLSQYLLLDEEKTGAVAALGTSNRLTQHSKWSLFKLDVSFWWYYLLQLLASALAYGPELLSLAGVTLPISPGVASILFYALYAGASLALSWWAGAYVQTTYACAYEQLCTPPEQYQELTNPDYPL